MQLLYRINRAGTTILMVTHDREMVDKMRKRVIALEEGKSRPRRAARGLRIRMSRASACFLRGLVLDQREHLDDVRGDMTVLIGMFLLGLFIALGTWVLSWSDHVKKELWSRSTSRRARPTRRKLTSARRSGSDPRVKKVDFVSKEQAPIKTMQKKLPDALQDTLPSNPLPDSWVVDADEGRDARRRSARRSRHAHYPLARRTTSSWGDRRRSAC